MKLQEKNKNSMLCRFLTVFLIALMFFSCSKSDDEFFSGKGKVYENSWIKIKIPQSYYVYTVDSDYGFRVLVVKNSRDQMVMYFYGSLRRTDFSVEYEDDLLTEQFELNNKIDTVGNYFEKPGEKLLVKQRIVVLQAKRHLEENKFYPLLVEFNCYPDYAEPNFCDKVVSSAQVVHLYP
ncbi:MAG: hypothetical protein SPL52_13295 [Fibrobacter sp.]|nr:hypothetical protein [Fibrobacter sp.]